MILAGNHAEGTPDYLGLERTCEEDADLRIFGKPSMRPKRRMGVVLVSGELGGDLEQVRDKVKRLAGYVQVVPKRN